MKPTTLDPRALVPNSGWTNSVAAGMAFKRCLLEQEQQAALQGFRAVAWSGTGPTQTGSALRQLTANPPGPVSPVAESALSAATEQAAPALPAAIGLGGGASWLATSCGTRSTEAVPPGVADSHALPEMAGEACTVSQDLAGVSPRVLASLAQASETWQRRRLHLTPSGDGVHAWLRDSTLDGASAALPALLTKLRQALAEFGLVLNGLSLNGRDIPLATT